MASILPRIALLLAGLCLFVLLGLNKASPRDDDPYRCQATLDTGRWTDTPKRGGDRSPFRHWQPKNCILHEYTAKDIEDCLEGRSVLFSGDETVEQAAWGLARLLNRKKANHDREKIKTPSWTVTYAGTKIQYHSNPALEVDQMLLGELETMRSESDNPAPIEEQKGAAMIMLGAVRSFAKRDHDGVNEIEKYMAAVSNISEALGPRKNFAMSPLDPVDGIGNQVFFQPPTYPASRQIFRLAAADKDISTKYVTKMHNWLLEHDHELNFPVVWSFMRMHANTSGTYHHYRKNFTYEDTNAVAEDKAMVLLNLRCNAKWDQDAHKRMQRTCCIDYAGNSPIQRPLVLAGLAYLFMCMAGEALDLITRRTQPRWRLFNMTTGAIVLAVLMCYFADRTQMFGKEGRVWQGWGDYFMICLPVFIIGLATIRKSRVPPSKPGHLTVEASQPFLSRDITDEWKGWMQASVLIYHWTSAGSKIGLHVFVRLVAGAYLFQTGYNHTMYLLIKKDYSFRRFAAVMIRLNLLAITLAFFMDAPYLGYYFAPLCSFWFAIVWLTLYIGRKRMNDTTQLVLAKICISAVIVPLLLSWTTGIEGVAWISHLVFNISFSVDEWQFHSKLDVFIVYFGMLVALANLRLKIGFNYGLRIVLGVWSAIVLGAYWFITQYRLSKATRYDSLHTYMEVIPIMAFVVLRNISVQVRNYSSRAMIWIGKCSLELYILQAHIFIAGDYHGILVIDGLEGSGLFLGRWRTLLITAPIIFWLSSQTVSSTRVISNLILGTLILVQPIALRVLTPGKEKEDKDEADNVPLLDVLDSGSLGLSRSTFRRCLQAAKGVVETSQARVGVCLVLVWVLNLLNR